MEMKMKIEKPNWYSMVVALQRVDVAADLLDTWFAEHVEPVNKMLAEGIEVRAYLDKIEGRCWFEEPGSFGENDTHKAIVLNIQPIKKDTAEDVLRDIVASWDKDDCWIHRQGIERARKVLDK